MIQIIDALVGETVEIICSLLFSESSIMLIVDGEIANASNDARLSFEDRPEQMLRVFFYANLTIADNGTEFQCASDEVLSSTAVLIGRLQEFLN